MPSDLNLGVVFAAVRLKNEFTPEMQKVVAAAQKAGQDMQAAGRVLTLGLTAPLVAAAAASIKASIDFESSFAGVRKTVTATEPELQALADGFRELALELPTNVNELNKIGEAAGQLGIQTENILGFTETMAALGETTNLSSDEAATALARLANITGLQQDEFDELGSAIVDLGNNFATTEKEIVDFGLRIAGAGELAGLTEGDILGIGTAMSSIGVQAEAGGTAVQKVLNSMNKSVATGSEELAVFAQVAGMTSEQFAKAFRDDAAGAFESFVTGLGQQGEKSFTVMEDLGLESERVIRAFLGLANSGDLLSEAMETGNRAFEENTALLAEAEQRYGTTESKLKMLWNRVVDLGITLGDNLVPALHTFIDLAAPMLKFASDAVNWWSKWPGPLKLASLAVVTLVAAIGPALLIGGTLLTSWASLAAVFPGMAAGIGTAALAVKGFTIAFLTSPIGWIALTIGAIAIAWVAWGDKISSFLSGPWNAFVNKLEGSYRILKTVGLFMGVQLPDDIESMKISTDDATDAVGKMDIALETAEKTLQDTKVAMGEVVTAATPIAPLLQAQEHQMIQWNNQIEDVTTSLHDMSDELDWLNTRFNKIIDVPIDQFLIDLGIVTQENGLQFHELNESLFDVEQSSRKLDVVLGAVAGEIGGASGQALNLAISMRESNRGLAEGVEGFSNVQIGAAFAGAAMQAIGEHVEGAAGRVLSAAGDMATAFATGGPLGLALAGIGHLISGIMSFGGPSEEELAIAQAKIDLFDAHVKKMEEVSRSAISAYEQAKQAGISAYDKIYEAALTSGLGQEEAAEKAAKAQIKESAKVLEAAGQHFARMAAFDAAMALGANASYEERKAAAADAARVATESWNAAMDVVVDSDQAATDAILGNQADVVTGAEKMVLDQKASLRSLTEQKWQVQIDYHGSRSGQHGGTSGGGVEGRHGFASGTGGRFIDFGRSSTIEVHGKERIVTEAEGRREAENNAASLRGVEDRLDRLDMNLQRAIKRISTDVTNVIMTKSL